MTATTEFTEWGVRWEDDAGQSRVHAPLDDEESARDFAERVFRDGAVVQRQVSITRGSWESDEDVAARLREGARG